MSSIFQDVRFALRQMRRSPGFVATAVLTLALGIGATTAIFTLVYQVMLRSLPVVHPEQLYKVGREIECCVDGGGQNDWRIFSYDLYKQFRDHTPGTDGIAAVQAGAVTVSARTENETDAQPLSIRFVSGNYFPLLGVRPFAGRLLRPEDDREGASPVAVLSHTLWVTKFHRDPHLVGSTLIFTGHPVTVVGITAEGFLGERNTGDPAGVWLPIAQEPVMEPQRTLRKFPNSHWLDLLVRIPNPHAVPAIERSLQLQLLQWIRANRSPGDGYTDADIAKQTTELAPASGGINDLRDQYEKSLKLLFLIAGAVLLICCANLANLLLARALGRRQEISVRTALGAPRWRLIRKMLVESVLIGLFGGVFGILLAYAGVRAILAMVMQGVEVDPLSAAPSLSVLLFALGLSLATGIFFGTVPAWMTSRAHPAEALRGANRSLGSNSSLPQRLLVILQGALSVVLLCTAGLLISSLRALEHQDLHFQTEGRLIAFVDLQAAGYKYEQLAGLYRRIDQAFAAVPGIRNVAYGTYGPMAGNNWSTGVAFPGGDPHAQNIASYLAISPNFFDAIGSHILLGRGITAQDTATGTHVAVVNKAFVEKYLKGKRPIGEHFGPDNSMTGEYQIVGVVEDTRYGDASAPVRPMFFTPVTQLTTYDTINATADLKAQAASSEHFKHYATNLVIHYQGDAAAAANTVRATLHSIDPGIPILRMLPYSEEISTSFTQQELVVRLTSLFGFLALLLASIGLYGVTAYAVTRRTGEIGVRMALGASRGGVLGLVLRGALQQTAIGMAIGIPLSLLAGYVLQHSLYQTSGFQPKVLLAVITLLLLAATMAALVPARRAANLDPMKALRAE